MNEKGVTKYLYESSPQDHNSECQGNVANICGGGGLHPLDPVSHYYGVS